MMLPLLYTFLWFNAQVNAQIKSSCSPNERVTYSRISHDGSNPLGNAEVVIPRQNLEQCAQLCSANSDGTGNEYPCSGFDLIGSTSTCMLSGPVVASSVELLDPHQGENSLLGNFVNELFKIVPTPAENNLVQNAQPGEDSGFYQKSCINAIAAAHLPVNVINSFEQVTNRVLLGSTEEVVSAENVAECLSACLQSKQLFGFDCRSSMFYYETGDCLLNSVDRKGATKPLSDETDGFKVDYFENKVTNVECGPGTVRQYVRLVGENTVAEQKILIEKVSLKTCEHYCTVNRAENGQSFSCRGFAFKLKGQLCYLMDDKPVGINDGNLVNDVEIYEKICLTAPSTCIKKPAFEMISGYSLLGFSEVVLENVRSDENCLSECMESHRTLGFVCLSVMFYYDSNQCILNHETRINAPTEQFINDTSEHDVKYFDNLCAINNKQFDELMNSCPEKTQATYVETMQTELAEFDTETYSGIGLDECLLSCESSLNFTCASADYRGSDQTCTLSYQNTDTTPLLSVSDTNHYERRCIQKSRYVCGAMGVSFSSTTNAYLKGFASVSVSGMSLDECLGLCLQDPSRSCRSVNYASMNSTCQLNNSTALNQTLYQNNRFSYYENRCTDTIQASSKNTESERAPVNTAPSSNRAQVNVEGASFLGETLAQVTSNVEPSVVTDCQYGQMRVLMSADQPFNGFMFAKNKFGSCSQQIANSPDAVLELGFPSDYGSQQRYGSAAALAHPAADCGVIEIGRGKYSAIVIVTTNNIGIPGLVTEADRFFNVTCDYTNALSSKVTATGAAVTVSNQPNIPVLYPDGKIYIPAPVAVSLQRNGQIVRMATLGEQLELRFDYLPEFKRDLMGVFIRQCNASRAYGLPPQPQPLVMIDDGCPMPAVQQAIVPGPIQSTATGFVSPFNAFKFDGGAAVKITCIVDLCEGECNPTSCLINGNSQQSHGRKKRATLEKEGMNGKKNRTTRTSSIIFTVVEKLPTQQLQVHYKAGAQQEQKLQNYETMNESDDFVQDFVGARHRQVCLKKATFIAVFTFLTIICIIQIILIGAYFMHRWLRTLNNPKKLK